MCKISLLRTFNTCSTTTHHTPLIIHNFSYTTHQTPLIIHHSSYTTHHTPLIIHNSSRTSHHTPLITHHSSYTTHHTPLIIHHSSHTTDHTPLIMHHSSHTTHHTPLITHHSSYTTHHTPLIIHRSLTHQLWFKQLKFQTTPAPQVQISWQVQHFVNLHVQISWQVQHFVHLHVQISWQAQHFVNLHVQISWRAQHFVHLHVQMSWRAQYKMRCGESCSESSVHWVTVFTCFLKWRFRGRCSTLWTSMCRFRGSCSTLSTSMRWFSGRHTLCEPPCDFVAGPPCGDVLAGAIQNALWRDSERTKLAIQGLRNSRSMFGIGIRICTCFLKSRFCARCSTLWTAGLPGNYLYTIT